MSIIYLLFFGCLPSIIWLLYFLREDVHPEPKKEIFLVFLSGMLSAFGAAFLEIAFRDIFNFFSYFWSDWLTLIVITPIIEEFLKYFVVREIVIFNSVVDEPTDIPIYMITSAMGFAALENIFLMFPFISPLKVETLISLSYARFLTATLLHALSSGIFGIAISFSLYYFYRKKRYFLFGLLGSILLHSFYDSYIMNVGNLLGVLIFLLILLIFLIILFRKLKRLPGVCRIKI